MNGIHEVAGSIPASSTKSLDNSTRRPIRRTAELSVSCPSWTEHPAANSVEEAWRHLGRPGRPCNPHVALFHCSRGPAAGTPTPSSVGQLREALASWTPVEALGRAPRRPQAAGPVHGPPAEPEAKAEDASQSSEGDEGRLGGDQLREETGAKRARVASAATPKACC